MVLLVGMPPEVGSGKGKEMSILIKMEMPKSCSDCPMCCDYYYCNLARRGFGEADCVEIRMDWCPLIELPPHGLIDKQMLLRNIADNQFAHSSVGHEEDYAFWGKVWDYIFDAPTIIESEE